jgi:hypothetical protein
MLRKEFPVSVTSSVGFDVMGASVLVMCDLNGRPDFPALRQPDETRCFAARQSISARLARLTVPFQNGTPTVPYAELTILFGMLVLVFA